jgi:drug/metabolite transporter (DMT)-like permease
MTPNREHRLSPANLILLAALTLAWGVNWPVMKMGVGAMPPMQFRAWCIGLALVVMALWALLRRESLAVPRRYWRTVAALAVPNMVVWHVLAIYGVKYLASGRAAILGYTMPLWVLLLSVLFYREHITRRQWLGAMAAGIGVAALLFNEFSHLAGRPLGVGLMLLAAASWGWGTMLLRRAALPVSTLAVTFWMLALALLALFICSALIEPMPTLLPPADAWGPILYNAFLGVAFSHLAWFHLARILPPMASGLSVMLIPVVGVLSSAWLGRETILPTDWFALAAICVSLACVLLPARPASAPSGA